MNTRGPDRETIPGGVAVLRDVNGDGRADETHRFGENGGNEVLLAQDYLYFATDDAVLRYPFPQGSIFPSGPPDTLVFDLPNIASHRAKSLALGPGGRLFVNIGSPSNACQTDARTPGSPGMDPCPQLETRAGIWAFDAASPGQTQADGTPFATGLRNTVALTVHPSGELYGVVHGRDQLAYRFGDLFSGSTKVTISDGLTAISIRKPTPRFWRPSTVGMGPWRDGAPPRKTRSSTSRHTGHPTTWPSIPATSFRKSTGAERSWLFTAPGTAPLSPKVDTTWCSSRSTATRP
jgi:hypothetical protein